MSEELMTENTTESFLDRRREPRVRLRVSVTISGTDTTGAEFRYHTKTFDLSPSGISIEMQISLAVGSVIHVEAMKFAFAANAIVRSNRVDRTTNVKLAGIEFLDGKKMQIVEWH